MMRIKTSNVGGVVSDDSAFVLNPNGTFSYTHDGTEIGRRNW